MRPALLCLLLAVLALGGSATAKGHRAGGAGKPGGSRYAGGRGSSHRGGKYKNSATGNRYRKHKKIDGAPLVPIAGGQ